MFKENLIGTNCEASKEVIIDVVLQAYDIGFNIL